MSNKKINVTRREFLNSYRNHYRLYCTTAAAESPKTRRLILCPDKNVLMNIRF